jgi:hypothetical protein
MRDKCEQIRTEMESRYKQRVDKKVDKIKSEFAVNREKDIRQEYDTIIDSYEKKNQALDSEVNKLKKDLKKVQIKNRQLKL